MAVCSKVHCKRCNLLIGDGSTFAFYQQTPTSFHFVVKQELADKFNSEGKVKRVEETDTKKKKFCPFNLHCLGCDLKLANESLLGPACEPLNALKGENIVICRMDDQRCVERLEFEEPSRTSQVKRKAKKFWDEPMRQK